MASNLTLTTLNVNHTRHLGGLADLIDELRPDILLLQEVPLDTQAMLQLAGGYRGCVNPSLNGAPGTAILYRNLPGEPMITNYEPGRLQELAWMQGGEEWRCLNVYGPSGTQRLHDRQAFYGETLHRVVHTRRPQIMGGDWNCLAIPGDTQSQHGRRLVSRELQRLLKVFKYNDASSSHQPTFHRPGVLGARLDRVYGGPGVEMGEPITTATLSDHLAITVSLPVAPSRGRRERVPGRWKMNGRLLGEGFGESFNSWWKALEAGKATEQDWGDWWEEEGKPAVRHFLQQWEKSVKRGRSLLAQMRRHWLKKALMNREWERAEEVRGKLRAAMQEGVELLTGGVEVEGEPASVYHTHKMAGREEVSTLDQLTVDGRVVNDREVIRQQVEEYFNAIYQRRHIHPSQGDTPEDSGHSHEPDWGLGEEFLQNLPQLQDHDRMKLEGELDLEEVKAAVKSMGKYRAPGEDGIGYEFYQLALPTLAPTLLEIFKAQLAAASLPPSARMGLTRLLPKVGGRPPQPSELRPITLLNSDYKLLTKLLATRLNAVLPDLLKSSQLCSRAPQTILSGITELLAAMETTKTKYRAGYIISFDVFKAYDRAHVGFIARVSERMGFGPQFTNWIRLVHAGATTRMMLGGGQLSAPISVENSLRQGDPLAMPLFILGMEPLLLKLESQLRGIQVGRQAVRTLAYVDDLQVAAVDLQDMVQAVDTLRKFELASGALINRSKTRVMGLGVWRERQDWPVEWITPAQQLKIFGVVFQPSVEETRRGSWDLAVGKVEKCLKAWGGRPLTTIVQRKQALQAFAWSKIWYLAQVLAPTSKHLARLRQMASKFLWMGRLERLTIPDIEATKDKGGLGLHQLDTRCEALATAHILRMWQEEGGRAKAHVQYWVATLRGDRTGPRAEVPTPYFRWVNGLLSNIGARLYTGATPTRAICEDLRRGEHLPKIWEIPRPWTTAFRRVWGPTATPAQQDLMWTVLHNVYPSPQRLHRLNQAPDDKCGCGEVGSVEHIFTGCNTHWGTMKRCLGGWLPTLPDWEILSLTFPRQSQDEAVTLTVLTTVEFIHQQRRGTLPRRANLMRHIKEAALTLSRRKPKLGQQLALLTNQIKSMS